MAEIAVDERDGDIFKRVERAQRRAEARAADLLEKRRVDALARKALRLGKNGGAHLLRLLALTAGAQDRNARKLVEAAAKARIDEPLVVKALVKRRGVAKQHITGHLADERLAHEVFFLRRALEAHKELRQRDLHLRGGLVLRGRSVLLFPVAAADLLAALAREDLFRQCDHRVHIDVADDAQRHVGGAVKRMVAVVERLRGNARDALDRAGDGHARGRGAVQAGKQPFIDLPVG